MNSLNSFLMSLALGSSACMASGEGDLWVLDRCADFREVAAGKQPAQLFLTKVEERNANVTALLDEAQRVNESLLALTLNPEGAKGPLQESDVRKISEALEMLREAFDQQNELISFMAWTTESLNGEGFDGTISQRLNRIEFKLNSLINKK